MNDDDRELLLYPRYIEQEFPRRSLAYFDKEHMELVREDALFCSVPSFEEFLQTVFTEDLLTFIPSIFDFPWQEKVIEITNPHDRKGTAIICVDSGRPTSIRLKWKRYVRWIVQVTSWNHDSVSLDFLRNMRNMYTYVGVGTQTTPGALGSATMRQSWKQFYGLEWLNHRHLRPSGGCIQDLRRHNTGGRIDALESVGKSFELLFELDRKNSYATEFAEQPTGKCVAFMQGETFGLRKWFAHCTVTVRDPLLLGPFPMHYKDEEGLDLVSYPTLPGVYDTWLWNDEVALCRSEGCDIEVLDGWGWAEITHDTQTWVEQMEKLRDEAPDEFTANIIKLATVAAIGRHGMPQQSYILVQEKDKSPGDQCIAFDGRLYDWYIHAVYDWQPQGMQHWFNHTLMRARIALFKLAKKYAEQEQLVRTNIDALFVLPSVDVSQYPTKQDPSQNGAWRVITHTNIEFPASNHIRSDQKIRTPGISRKQKKVLDTMT